MIYSMTGYGKAEGEAGGKHIVIELKSLNGKQFEITNRINSQMKRFEADIRSMLIQALTRGSVDVTVSMKQDGAAKPVQINEALAKHFFETFTKIGSDLGVTTSENAALILANVMRMPEVVVADADGVSDDEWLVIKDLISKAAQNLMAHRLQEGHGLQKDIINRINNIIAYHNEVASFESERIERIKVRIQNALQDFVNSDKLDMNRFEQEVIYYLEKNDFSEEKQRLNAHCNYFFELINDADTEGVGKKIGFVLQEIGREINTLGSKANDSNIQKIVVNMKDELEKAKEQCLNIL